MKSIAAVLWELTSANSLRTQSDTSHRYLLQINSFKCSTPWSNAHAPLYLISKNTKWRLNEVRQSWWISFCLASAAQASFPVSWDNSTIMKISSVSFAFPSSEQLFGKVHQGPHKLGRHEGCVVWGKQVPKGSFPPFSALTLWPISQPLFIQVLEKRRGQWKGCIQRTAGNW